MNVSLVTSIILGAITVANIFFIGFIIFHERKSPVTTIAWILTFTFLPVIGFIFYIVFGGSKRFRLGKMFKLKHEFDEYYSDKLLNHLGFGKKRPDFFGGTCPIQYSSMIRMLYYNSKSIYTKDNDLSIFTDASDKYESLIHDINNAKKNIHLLYFIINNDNIGKKLVEALAQKAREGVEVRLLYDDIGSAFTPFSMFKELIASGGEVLKFLSSKLGLININANFRNHRKIVVIDGEIGYLGGMNVGDEYMGLNKRISPWRDTHLRITGSSVYMLQTRFLLDWAYASKEDNNNPSEHILNDMFPLVQNKGDIGIQIVSSGPDTGWGEIKNGLIKMINTAQKSIYIQTPYFIPDQTFLDALKIASVSGVDVKVMIPGIADKRFVFHGTNSYIKDLLEIGAKVYMYEGFMHSKMLIMDDKIVSIGTTNIDIRSFELDFEINAFIYNTKFGQKCMEFFEEDIKASMLVTQEWHASRSWIIKLTEAVCRLLSPVL